MTIKRADFADFFRALHDDCPPFRWQERLLDELLSAGAWPDRIVAPTGAGKTAVIDVHVFAVALSASLGQPRLPRRLAMVVGRRVLVDDQYEHAVWVARALRDARDGLMAEVATQLRALRRPQDQGGSAEDAGEPLVVARLRGGTAPSLDWRDEPTACAVICATPEMWGSRLLLRGYGTSSRARSREAGLLALDAAVVVDEAHLSRQLLTTANRVARLVPVADEPLPVPHLQVIETTATPAGNGATGRSVEVVPDDLTDEPVLADRMTRPKPVELVFTKDWPASTRDQHRRVAALMADQVIELLTQATPRPAAVHTVGCYVNTVKMAIDGAQALRSRQTADGRA
ncbi:MAG: type I-U CRISPR-associated helicase/endonuclease Cas3, partial [Dactylosporangium sp.]|nr:type I-U CRISPR-associated helicase/endonuclease Cas3 [Dactylosporangium sp.]